MNDSLLPPLSSVPWPPAVHISASVAKLCQTFGSCSVMLTGGRSAAQLYEAWRDLPEFQRLRNVKFFFGDERCVPPDHPESNCGLAMRTLFKYGLPSSCELIRIEAEKADRDSAALAYERHLPNQLDILLLSMGEDGHIASLFPHSSALFETHRRVLPVTAPKPPCERLTVTPCVITQARQVFVMAFGKKKTAVYDRAKLAPHDFSAIPARLVLNAIWFLDA